MPRLVQPLGGAVAIGAVANTVADQRAASPQLAGVFAQMGGAGPGDGFVTVFLLARQPDRRGVRDQATLRLSAEETGGRADSVLAASVGRLRWAASHLVFARSRPRRWCSRRGRGHRAGHRAGSSGSAAARSVERPAPIRRITIRTGNLNLSEAEGALLGTHPPRSVTI